MSSMFSVPEYEPAAVGEKLTLIVHMPDGGNVLPQVVLSIPNTLLLVPMPVMLTVPPTAVLGLVTVTTMSGLVVPLGTTPNFTEVGDSVSAASVPVPLSAIAAGLLLALLTTLRLPVFVPTMVGVKFTPTVQLEPAIPLGARMVEPMRLQGFEPIGAMLKLPDTPMLLTVSATELGLVSVAVPAVELVVPT